VDVLRAFAPRFDDVPELANAAQALGAADAPLAVRYRMLEPLASLAGLSRSSSSSSSRTSSPAARATLEKRATGDAHAGVRTMGLHLLAALGPIPDEVRVQVLRDRSPRVREELAHSAARFVHRPGGSESVALLMTDPWSFVRRGVLTSFFEAPRDAAFAPFLRTAVGDEVPTLRGLAIEALAKHSSESADAALVRDRFRDEQEDVGVRASAARSLGAMCDTRSVESLTTVAVALADPTLDPRLRVVGEAALSSLGKIHPADLTKRLSSLTQKGAPPPLLRKVRDVVEGRGLCR